MAPFKSSLARSVGKLLGVFKERDLSLRGATQESRRIAPITATGGAVFTPDNGFAYNVFKVSDNSQPTGIFLMPALTTATTIQILLVAGGGSGGNYPSGNSGGAGGAGGIVYWPAFSVTKDTNYTIVIGSGGAGTTANDAGEQGDDSTITFAPGPVGTAKGGGKGNAYQAGGSAGGSGAGGSGAGPNSGGAGNQPAQAQPIGGSYTQYGNAGGAGPPTNSGASSGGGGAGGAGGASTGADNNDNKGGDGQPFTGFEYPLVGLPGVNPTYNPSPTSNHYGGGGAGSRYSPRRSAEGGLGGGGGSNGQEEPSHPSANGMDGLGSGGAGGDAGSGDGGNGICIIRYAI